MRMTLSKREVERICLDRFKIALDDVLATGATINCKWHDYIDAEILEIVVEPYAYDATTLDAPVRPPVRKRANATRAYVPASENAL